MTIAIEALMATIGRLHVQIDLLQAERGRPFGCNWAGKHQTKDTKA
jgi:hypothetical protein